MAIEKFIINTLHTTGIPDRSSNLKGYQISTQTLAENNKLTTDDMFGARELVNIDNNLYYYSHR